MLDRDRRATERRIKAARFAVVKSLETFDYLAMPSLNKKLVRIPGMPYADSGRKPNRVPEGCRTVFGA
jgi:hypothetical protein